MSTVLWANVLIDGVVTSDEDDYYALYKHADKLDQITQSLGLPSFSAICDSTDLQFNMDDDAELPDGIESTDEVMAKNGLWMPAQEAIAMLTALREHIATKNVRFGLVNNQQADVLAELEGVLAFAKRKSKATKFNFSIVM